MTEPKWCGFTRKPTKQFREELKADGYGLLMEFDEWGVYYNILLLPEIEKIEAEAINERRLDMARKIAGMNII